MMQYKTNRQLHHRLIRRKEHHHHQCISPLVIIRIGVFGWLSFIIILINILHAKIANHTNTNLILMTTVAQHQEAVMLIADGSTRELKQEIRVQQKEENSIHHSATSNSPGPFFVMGLPGSGLDALHHFFNCTGLRVQYYDPDDCGLECKTPTQTQNESSGRSLFQCMIENRERQIPIMQGCDQWIEGAGKHPFQVFTSFSGITSSSSSSRSTSSEQQKEGFFLPQHYHLNELHEYSPNATWILPLIDTTIWTERSHYKMKWRGRFRNEFLRYNKIGHPGDGVVAHTVLLSNNNAVTAEMVEIQSMAEFFNNHTQKVREFCRQHPSHNLVELNLMGAEGLRSGRAKIEAILKRDFGLDSITTTSCWSSDPLVDDNTPNHLHGIVKQTIEKSYDVAPKLSLPLPIIVVGHPKSGTTSVSAFFRCAGILTQHYCCCGDVSDRPPCYTNKTMAECISNNLNNNSKPILEGCGDYPVYAQLDGEMKSNGSINVPMSHFLPQHFYLDKLHDYAPNATYVLPLRDPMAWAESVINWFNMRKRLVNEYRLHQIPQAFEVMNTPKKNITRTRDFLRDIYQNHTEMIRQFVHEHPSHNLVEFNITQQDAGTVMSHAFGLPSSCWNHENKNNKKLNSKG